MSALAIVPVGREPERMCACERLAREVFGFAADEGIPGWLIHTATHVGGVARAALLDGEVVGFFFAFPGVEAGERLLFLTEVCVAPGHRRRGIAVRLLAEARAAALAQGCTRITLTTDALSARNLHLYLVRCGARLVAYHPEMYRGLIGGADGDEAGLEWRLEDPAVEASLAGRRPPDPPAGRADARNVELPWDADALVAEDPARLSAWRGEVRGAVQALLAEGWVGVDLRRDVGARRSFVMFARKTD